MSYNTRYELTWDGDIPVTKQCASCNGTGQIVVSNPVREALHIKRGGVPSFDDHLAEPTTWYGHEEDLRALSREFPSVLFTLRGQGEESGDIWTKYFQKGLMQTSLAEITIEGFDPKKLK